MGRGVVLGKKLFFLEKTIEGNALLFLRILSCPEVRPRTQHPSH